MNSHFNMKQVIGVAAFSFGSMANNVSMAVLAYIMMTYANESPVTVQSILVTPGLIGMIFAFAVAPLNKIFSSRTLIMVCELALVIMGPIFMFGGGSLPVIALIAAAGLMGFGQGALNVFVGLQMFAAIGDETKRATWTGIIIGIGNFGGIVYAVAGGAIAGAVGWQMSYFLATLFGLIGFIAALTLIPKSAPEGAASAEEEVQAGETASGNGGMGKVLLISVHFGIFFMFVFTYGSNISEFVVTTHTIGAATDAGIASSMVMAGGAVAGFALGGITKALKRFTGPIMIAIASVGVALCVIFTDNFLIACIAGFLSGFGQFGSTPYLINLMHDVVDSEKQYGTAVAICSGFMNFGMVVAVYVMAFLAQTFFGDGSNVDAKFLISTIGLVVVVITSFPIYLSVKPKNAQ